METLTQLKLVHEIDETLAVIVGDVTKAQVDPFHDQDAELALRAQLADGWNRRLVGAYAAALNIARMGYKPDPQMIPHIIQAFRSHLSGTAFTNTLHPQTALGTAFNKGKQQVLVQSKKKSVSRFRRIKNEFFGLLFGMTESHATQALYDQLMLSAGGFFDEQMTEVIRGELDSWFKGDLTKDDLVANLRTMTNTRLSSNGEQSQPKSYFEGLAEHYIVRSRNFGGIYQADNLGVTHYQIQGILDHRTSPICKPLIESGALFELAGAKDKMHGILKVRDVGTLKRTYPFLTSPKDAVHPIPPLHWRCRSWMEYVL